MMHWDLGPLPAPRALLEVKYSSSPWQGKGFDETTLCTVRGSLFPRRVVCPGRTHPLPPWKHY